MKLPFIFADGAIFAAHRKICVFGEGRGAVKVTFAGNTVYTAAKDGKFRAFLPAMTYGGPYELAVADADETLCFTDIYVGEVYIMAGQSNMQFKLNESSFPVVDYFDDSLLRVFSTDRVEDSDTFHAKDGWVGVTKENAGYLTAIGVLTGEEIRKKKDVPVGIIACYQGASVIESWLPLEVASLPQFTVPEDDRFYDHYDSFYGQWNHNGDLYCAMLPQIVPYSVSGIVWYQGESDVTTSEALIYKDELLAMIGLWRSDFLDPDLPFYVIQIADCDDRAWPCWYAIQKAQADAADDAKHVYCIVCRDICESNTIHPTRKYELSKRLADKICETQ